MYYKSRQDEKLHLSDLCIIMALFIAAELSYWRSALVAIVINNRRHRTQDKSISAQSAPSRCRRVWVLTDLPHIGSVSICSLRYCSFTQSTTPTVHRTVSSTAAWHLIKVPRISRSLSALHIFSVSTWIAFNYTEYESKVYVMSNIRRQPMGY